MEKEKFFNISDPDWKAKIPKVIFEENPEYLELYDRAWELAHEHILELPGMPQTPYMDEGFLITDIWIWDTCFMLFFCKYAPDIFPGIESLNNFYEPLHGGKTLPETEVYGIEERTGYKDGSRVQVKIHIPDNPPLFAWAEYAYALMTGDRRHLEELLLEKKYLQRHFEFLESLKETGFVTDYTHAPSCLVKHEHGYFWEGGRSGMDNTPRGRIGKNAVKERPNNPDMLWIDAIAQQGLSALCISEIAQIIGEKNLAAQWRKIYESFKNKVNDLYWDEDDGIYYDIHYRTLEKIKCLTPASFWPMLAQMPTEKQAEKMCNAIRDKNKLGGQVPWTTLGKTDPDFAADGNYWRGSLWLPTAYMGIKSLEKYGKFDLANETARKVVHHMYRTFKEYTPHTIWECYDPVKPAPSTFRGKRVRPDFCGWSALGPICLFIENVIGLTGADAFKNTLVWNLPPEIKGEIGVTGYSFGNVVTDVVYCNGRIRTRSNVPYSLIVNGKTCPVTAGDNSFTVV